MEQEKIQGNSYTVVDPSWAIALKVWWSYTWRMIFWIIPASLTAGIISAGVVKFSGGTKEDIGVVGFHVFAVLMLMLNVLVFKRLIRIKYKDVRLVLVSRRD